MDLTTKISTALGYLDNIRRALSAPYRSQQDQALGDDIATVIAGLETIRNALYQERENNDTSS